MSLVLEATYKHIHVNVLHTYACMHKGCLFVYNLKPHDWLSYIPCGQPQISRCGWVWFEVTHTHTLLEGLGRKGGRVEWMSAALWNTRAHKFSWGSLSFSITTTTLHAYYTTKSCVPNLSHGCLLRKKLQDLREFIRNTYTTYTTGFCVQVHMYILKKASLLHGKFCTPGCAARSVCLDYEVTTAFHGSPLKGAQHSPKWLDMFRRNLVSTNIQ